MPKPYLLAISSWFPNKLDPSHGLFNLQIIQAVSKIAHTRVIHVKHYSGLNEKVVRETKRIQSLEIDYYYFRSCCEKIPILGKLIKLFLYQKTWNTALKNLIKTYGMPSAVQIQVIYPAIIGLGSFLKKHPNLPLLISENWSGYSSFDGNYRGFFLKRYTRFAVKRSKAVITSSEFLKKAMQKQALKANYHVIPNPIDTRFFKPELAKTESLKFVHVSSLTQREKNIKGILDAFALARKQGFSFTLECIGEGSERTLWTAYSKSLNLEDCVAFTGYQTADYIKQRLQEATALVMFSFYETFSVVVLESLACGTPVICSDAGAIPEYFNLKLGMMIPSGDVQKLSQALMEFNPDAYPLKQLTNFVNDFCSDVKVTEQWKNIYKDLQPELISLL